MIRLLRFLITGSWHEHKWKIIRQGSLHQAKTSIAWNNQGEEVDGPTIGYWYDLQCESCGTIKHTRNV